MVSPFHRCGTLPSPSGTPHANMPHLSDNPSATVACTGVLARTDPKEQEAFFRIPSQTPSPRSIRMSAPADHPGSPEPGEHPLVLPDFHGLYI